VRKFDRGLTSNLSKIVPDYSLSTKISLFDLFCALSGLTGEILERQPQVRSQCGEQNYQFLREEITREWRLRSETARERSLWRQRARVERLRRFSFSFSIEKKRKTKIGIFSDIWKGVFYRIYISYQLNG
jgi:hypothetical protein